MTLVDAAARATIRDDLDDVLFVEAGAGTGKTTALVSRYLSLVARGISPASIAAITFTEKAAAELRERVRVALGTEAAAGHDWAASALEALHDAPISTLHAFAARLLTEHPVAAGLPPGFEVLDERAEARAFDAMWSETLAALMNHPGLGDVIVRGYGLGLQITHLRRLAEAFHRDLERIPRDWALLPPWGELPSVRPLDTGPLREKLRNLAARACECTAADDRMAVHLREVVGPCSERLTDADELDALHELVTVGLKMTKGKASAWLPGVKDELVAACAALEQERTQLVAELRREVLDVLAPLVAGAVLQFAQTRRQRGTLTFQDLLLLATDMLRRDARVRAEARVRYQRLLIDEFQDTDPLQLEMAQLLCAGEPEARLFVVGDPKQSIYRFRRADLGAYLRARRDLGTEPTGRTVHLVQSFRSVPGVLDAVNHVFGTWMVATDTQPQYVPLAASHERASPEPPVHVLGRAVDARVGEVREEEASELAAALAEIVATGWTVRDPRTGTERPARYGDIAILLPTRTTLAVLERALDDAGVPYRVEARSLVYATAEVRDLAALLGAIHDPTDEIAIVGALRSPALGCTDRELAQWRATGRRWNYLEPDRRRIAPSDVDADDGVVAAVDDDVPAVRTAMALLAELHAARWWLAVGDLVELVVDRCQLRAAACAYRRPRDHWRRIQFVIEQARAFDAEGGRSLGEFVRWLRDRVEDETAVDEGVAFETDDDAVRVLTVHAAKGLEFPIVVLSGLDVRRMKAEKPPVLWTPEGMELRVGTQAAEFATPGYTQAAEREDEAQRDEQVRLLYVAMTRARDHLVLSLWRKARPARGGELTHAQELAARLEEAPHLWRPFTPTSARPADGADAIGSAPESSMDLAAWRAAVEQRRRRSTVSPVVTASSLHGDDAPVDGDEGPEDAPPGSVRTVRRGRAATAVGRAVHAALQVVDFDGRDLPAVALAAAEAEGVAGEVRLVESLCRAVLATNVVGMARQGRAWRELFVATPLGDSMLEGFIDLLLETPEGELVVVDYKTDRIPSGQSAAGVAARYRLQGAAYAVAVERVLGRPVDRVVFVLAQPGGALEEELTDLAAAKEEVLTVAGAA